MAAPRRPDPATADLLARVVEGETHAPEQLLPQIYDRLRSLAGSYLGARRDAHTLQPTALVHEAFVELAGKEVGWEGRAHFLAMAAKAMRDILLDYERRRRAAKRGGDGRWRRMTIGDVEAPQGVGEVDLLALDEALDRLAELDPRQARIVELRYFSGMTGEEIGAALGVSRNTVVRELAMARAWLLAALDDSDRDPR